MENDEMEVFLEALVTGNPGQTIMNQEKRGQNTFAASEKLPIRCPRAELEALGFVFGNPLDDLFIACQFPSGWTKRTTDHSLWTELIDPNGNVRGSIFYKAAFYDRDAFMSLTKLTP